jgi:exonuclease III
MAEQVAETHGAPARLDRVFVQVGGGALATAVGRGFVDAFRVVNQKPDQYTWWSQRGAAREKNVGWRIDYHLLSPEFGGSVERASIYTGKYFSDHAPLTIDYAL